MNAKKIALRPKFGAETSFELQPTPETALRGVSEDAFERLKDRLFAIRLAEAGTKWETALRDAAGEAAALAWTTTVPLLVFPALFEEKMAAAVCQDKRQARILRKSRDLLAA